MLPCPVTGSGGGISGGIRHTGRVRKGYTLRMMGSAHPPVVLTACLLLCSLIFPAACRAEDSNEKASPSYGSFPVHGKLHFKVRYLGLTCGEMTLESHAEEYEGRPAYHIRMEAKNSKFFNKIYQVHTQIDSWVDVEHLGTIRYSSHSVEDGKERQEEIRVTDEEVVWTKRKGEQRFSRSSEEIILDPLAYLYRLESFACRPGSRPHLFLLTTKGPLETVAQVSGLLKVKTALGKRKVVRIRPRPVDGKMFSRKGELNMTVIPGEPPLLALLDFDLSFGHLKAILTSVDEVPEN